MAEPISPATKTKKIEKITMKDLVDGAGFSLVPFKTGDSIEVAILSVSRQKIIVDVSGLNLGIIPEREFSAEIADLKVGDKIFACVLSPENDDGYVVLSLRRADRERLWRTLTEREKSGEPLSVYIKDANRGGLMVTYGEIEGFLPVSQLSAKHYPRVEGGQAEQIVQKLNKLIGEVLKVKVLSFDRVNNKLIFSEKQVISEDTDEKIKNLKIGDEVKGKVVAITDFGLFVEFAIPQSDEKIEGLVHISEISWGKVAGLERDFKVGQPIDTMIIGLEPGRISLSIKRLLPDPWKKLAKQHEIGSMIKGEITRVTPYGAFVKITDDIEGLVHVSELNIDKKKPEEGIETGKKYDFYILILDPNNHRLSLSLKKPTKINKKESGKDAN